MSVHTLPARPVRTPPMALRCHLSLKEAVVLADVEEKAVRKDIEVGLLIEPYVSRVAGNRLCAEWKTVFIMAAVYSNRHLSADMRKTAIYKISDMCQKNVEPNWWIEFVKFRHYEHLHTMERKFINIDKYITLDLFMACHNVAPRMGLYAYGLSRIEEKEDILGGDAVFKESRLPVSHVGKMCENGESFENILEDYPYLNEDDVRFSILYHRAHPATGRPSRRGESNDNTACIG